MEIDMKTFMITTVLAASVSLSACSKVEAPTKAADVKVSVPDVKAPATNVMAAEAMTTKTKAVLVYADWCGSCKVLDPKIQKVKSMGGVPGVDFVTLDYTLKDADVFYAQADEAGVGKAVRDYLDGTIKTGVLLLVDLDDEKVIGKVTKTSEADEIVTALKTAVSAS